MPVLQSQPVSTVEELKHDGQGLLLLADWLGHGGKPVSLGLAQSRANVCLANQCPENVAPNWWDNAKGRIAEFIRRELELKHKLDLHVKHEDQLHICKPCGCCTRLKVWTPIKHIADHTGHKTQAQFPHFCWQRIELENYQKEQT